MGEFEYELIRKPHVHPQPNQSTIASDYHLDQLIFLPTREVSPSTATLITAGSMGWIWWWSIHVIGRLLAVFNGARKPGGSTVHTHRYEPLIFQNIFSRCVPMKNVRSYSRVSF